MKLATRSGRDGKRREQREENDGETQRVSAGGGTTQSQDFVGKLRPMVIGDQNTIFGRRLQPKITEKIAQTPHVGFLTYPSLGTWGANITAKKCVEGGRDVIPHIIHLFVSLLYKDLLTLNIMSKPSSKQTCSELARPCIAFLDPTRYAYSLRRPKGYSAKDPLRDRRGPSSLCLAAHELKFFLHIPYCLICGWSSSTPSAERC